MASPGTTLGAATRSQSPVRGAKRPHRPSCDFFFFPSQKINNRVTKKLSKLVNLT